MGQGMQITAPLRHNMSDMPGIQNPVSSRLSVPLYLDQILGLWTIFAAPIGQPCVKASGTKWSSPWGASQGAPCETKWSAAGRVDGGGTMVVLVVPPWWWSVCGIWCTCCTEDRDPPAPVEHTRPSPISLLVSSNHSRGKVVASNTLFELSSLGKWIKWDPLSSKSQWLGL